MKITETIIKGCFLLEPEIFEDNRGLFFESFKKNELEEALGYNISFVQENQSVSKKGVLRGLHFQKGDAAQAKLVSVIKGEVLDVVVDIRFNSDTYGKYFKVKLSDRNKKSVFIPKGMAHGFLSLSKDTIFTYKCDSYYNPKEERGVIYNDRELNIDWDFLEEDLILSQKDLRLGNFSEL